MPAAAGLFVMQGKGRGGEGEEGKGEAEQKHSSLGRADRDPSVQ